MSGWLGYLLLGVGVIALYSGALWLFIFSPWGELARQRKQ